MKLIKTILLIALTIPVINSPAWAEKEYSDQQIANAIYQAEGGKNAKYPYGIRSVKCSGNSDCLRICLTTIRNNRIRYAEYGRRRYNSFIAFLASRYAPIKADNDPKALNRNWIKNVNYFLNKEKSK